MGGLYRGYFSTILREIPFSFIQYPVWEYLKVNKIMYLLTLLVLKYKWSQVQESPTLPWQGAVCGAVAGGVAASVTTPLDVAKTRIMLAQVGNEYNYDNYNLFIEGQ